MEPSNLDFSETMAQTHASPNILTFPDEMGGWTLDYDNFSRAPAGWHITIICYSYEGADRTWFLDLTGNPHDGYRIELWAEDRGVIDRVHNETIDGVLEAALDSIEDHVPVSLPAYLG